MERKVKGIYFKVEVIIRCARKVIIRRMKGETYVWYCILRSYIRRCSYVVQQRKVKLRMKGRWKER